MFSFLLFEKLGTLGAPSISQYHRFVGDMQTMKAAMNVWLIDRQTNLQTDRTNDVPHELPLPFLLTVIDEFLSIMFNISFLLLQLLIFLTCIPCRWKPLPLSISSWHFLSVWVVPVSNVLVISLWHRLIFIKNASETFYTKKKTRRGQ